jgi:endonuclease YncB( thermonuclease family)
VGTDRDGVDTGRIPDCIAIYIRDYSERPTNSRRMIALAVLILVHPIDIDGDSFKDSRGEYRLVQVNTPEVGQCWHDEAQAVLKKYLKSGQKLSFKNDTNLDNLDKYGRRLGYLFQDRKNINIEIVRQGAGMPYFYNGKRGTYAREILVAMYYAKQNKLGQWGHCKTGENK